MFSGKTTSADYLVNAYGYERLAFARPVKEISAEILTLLEDHIGANGPSVIAMKSPTEKEVEEMRRQITEHYSGPNAAHKPIIVDQDNVTITRQRKVWTFADVEQNKGNPAVRKLLQLVGTELGRELIGYENVWVDRLIRAAYGKDNVVIDDCRFPNEAAALREHGFTLVRVTRPDIDRMLMMKDKYPDNFKEILTHASETALDNFEADMVLYAESLDSLYEQVEGLMHEQV
jgi:hypothetical protein